MCGGTNLKKLASEDLKSRIGTKFCTHEPDGTIIHWVLESFENERFTLKGWDTDPNFICSTQINTEAEIMELGFFENLDKTETLRHAMH